MELSFKTHVYNLSSKIARFFSAIQNEENIGYVVNFLSLVEFQLGWGLEGGPSGYAYARAGMLRSLAEHCVSKKTS